MPGNRERPNNNPRIETQKTQKRPERFFNKPPSQEKVDYINARGKLLGARDKLKKARQNAGEIQTNKANAEDVLKDLSDSVLPGEIQREKPDNKTDKKNLEESLAREEASYQVEFDKVLLSEKQKILGSNLTEDDKAKKITEIEREYIDTYATDLEIGERATLDPNYFAQKFPTAWKETLLDPKSTQNPQLKKVREKILEKVSREAEKVQKNPGESGNNYQERLLESFQEQTGLTLTTEEFEKFTGIRTQAQNTILPGVPTTQISAPPSTLVSSGGGRGGSENIGGGGGGSSYRSSNNASGGGGGGGYSSGNEGGGGYSNSSSLQRFSSSGSLENIPPPSILSSLPGDFKTNMGFWDASRVAEVRKNGGIWINMDCNQSDGRKVIPPIIVIPDDASPEMRAAAKAYVDAMAKLHNEKFGRDFNGQVKTRSQNGRGRSNTIHTEAWSIDDTQMVDFLKSEEGIQEYRQILASTLGKIPGAVFSLPHGAKDPGAVNSRGESEVSLAQLHLNGFSAEGQNPTPPETVASSTPVPAPAETKTVVISTSNNEASPPDLTTEKATQFYGPQT